MKNCPNTILKTAAGFLAGMALLASIAKAQVTVDFSTLQGPTLYPNQYVGTIHSVKGPADQKRMKAAGVTLERTFYSLALVSTAQGASNFSATHGPGFYGGDALLDDVVAQGAQPMVTLMQPLPDWLQNGFTGTTAQWSAYQQMITDILTHLHQRYPGLRYIELFNEPGGGLYAAQYNNFYLYTSKAVTTVNEATGFAFLLGGACGTAGAEASLNKGLLAFCQANHCQLDFISWHNYADQHTKSPADAIDEAREMQGYLDQYGYGTLPMLVTEWQYSAVNGSTDAGPAALAQSASFVASGWSLAANSGYGSRLRLFPFSLHDYAGNNRSVVVPNLGAANLRAADGDIFPLYNVYLMMSMEKSTQAKSVSSAATIHPLASIDSTGAALMVSDYGPATTTPVNFTNLPAAYATGSIHYQRYLVDATHGNWSHDRTQQDLQLVEDYSVAGATSFSVPALTLDAYATSLIVLTPGASGASQSQH